MGGHDGPKYADWEFDAQGEPAIPGGQDLAELIAQSLANVGCAASDVEQHEDYGWTFKCKLNDYWFSHVLNAVEPDIFLTVNLSHRPWRRLFFGATSRATLDQYCNLLTSALGTIPGVGKPTWKA